MKYVCLGLWDLYVKEWIISYETPNPKHRDLIECHGFRI
jgi:hypothetical protein